MLEIFWGHVQVCLRVRSHGEYGLTKQGPQVTAVTQSTQEPLRPLPALESAGPTHSSLSGADPTAQAGGETDKMPRELSFLSLLQLPQAVQLHLLGCLFI